MDRNLRRSPSRLAALSEMKRNKSPKRPKSPARKKSPARTKSPARPKSPARKSPGRKPSKSPARKKAPVQKSLSPIVKVADVLTRYSVTPNKEIKENSPATVENLSALRNSRSRESSRTLEEIRTSATRPLISGPNYNSDTGSSGITRRSSRLRSAPREFDGLRKDIEDEVEKYMKTNHVKASDYVVRSSPQEFGGRFGALLLIFLIPSFVLALQFSCVNKDKCKLFDFHLSTNWKFYLDPFTASWFIGFVFWQFLLSAIPLYKKVHGIPPKNDSLEYRCSGIINALLTLSVFGGLQYLKYPVTSIVTKTVPLLNAAILFAFLLSFVLYIKGGRPGVIQNSYGKTGSKIFDFWIGREINPRFGVLDIKQALTRIAVIGALLYDVAVILRATDNKTWSNYPPTILVITGLQILTLLDFLIFEENFLSSFFMQHEGTGYMFAIGSSVFPFFVTIVPKFLLLNQVDLNVYYLAALGFFYVLAYLVYRLSTNQKSSFRNNSSSFIHLESIPTVIAGKKLLSGGWWGVVRHPNYLGLILMYWILAASAGISHFAPYAVALASTGVLIHRAIRNSGRCKTLYSNSWDRYTQKVKYYLVPRVF